MKKKLCISLICLIMIIIFNFALPRLMPGDTVLMLIGMDEESVSAEQYAFYREKTGADKPLWVQFWAYIKGILIGDLGWSYHHNKSISSLLWSRIPVTLQIAIPSVVLSSLLALVLGTIMGMKSDTAVERVATSAQIILNAMPSFLVGLLLLLLFAFKLNWLPSGALNSIFVPSGVLPALFDRLKHLVLPVAAITIGSTPQKYLLMRSLVAAQKNEKYVLYARSRGLSELKIGFSHILPNVRAPFLSMVGMNVGSILGGSLIIENIFSIKGMGSLMSGAITARDYPVLQGCLLVSALMVSAAMLLTDLLIYWSDPLVRLKGNETE